MSEEYPVIKIPIDYLEYRWSAPHFREDQRQRVNGVYDRWCHILKRPENYEFNDRDRLVKLVYDSIVKEGLVNALLVKQHIYGEEFDGKKYYVVVGNQRLSCLKALLHNDSKRFQEILPGSMIPCRIVYKEDEWNDRTRARQVHPFKVVKLSEKLSTVK